MPFDNEKKAQPIASQRFPCDPERQSLGSATRARILVHAAFAKAKQHEEEVATHFKGTLRRTNIKTWLRMP